MIASFEQIQHLFVHFLKSSIVGTNFVECAVHEYIDVSEILLRNRASSLLVIQNVAHLSHCCLFFLISIFLKFLKALH